MLPVKLIEKFAERGFKISVNGSKYVLTREGSNKKLIIMADSDPSNGYFDIDIGVCELNETNPKMWDEIVPLWVDDQYGYFGTWMETCFVAGKILDCHPAHENYSEVKRLLEMSKF